jgi:hypothetical protein
MILSTVMNAAALLAIISSGSVLDQCPLATLTCNESPSGKARYECSILAHYPSKRNAPQYTWEVSEGRILGDPKSPTVTIDVGGVKSEMVTVTARVDWRRIPRACDAYMTEKITLR